MTIQIKQLDDLAKAAAAILSYAGDRRCFLLYGEIGAGKTTLVKKITELLGVEEAANSPTFSLVNEYSYTQDGKRGQIYHIDLYRLESMEEALDIGMEEYLYEEEAFCFVEWPELIEDIVPDNCVKIKIEIKEDSSRKFIFL